MSESAAALCCLEDDSTLTVSGVHFTVIFDKSTGLIRHGKVNQKRILMGGPCLNTPYLKLDPRKKSEFASQKHPDKVVIKTAGS